ncbi:NAD(P)/FAD-dependent oxidoreductase [Cellulomonas sp. McL0617]|uniref:NAD(P)/FAD-dependent oxidoreductase n=1 Tax=Cellulomonas sp. McL0617 TaxID=3415675 RepID=UPI003CEE86A4
MSGARTRPDVDVLVAGGGPVGLAVAIEARLAGLRTVVVEPRTTPIDKACGEGLMPGAVAALARLGVHPAGHPLTGIRYLSGDRAADHLFTGATGLGVRRTALHLALAIRAEELGVEVLAGKVDTVAQDAGSVTAAGIRAAWLMACDGLHSTVRRQLGLDRPARAAHRRRYGIRRHYRVAPWTDLVEVHWGRHVEAYVTPVAPDVVGVALLGPPHHDYDRSLDSFPDLRRHLGAAPTLGPPRGAGPLLQRTSARTAGRVRLVGDASGYVDALTGEGVRVGLAQATAAVRTLGPDVDRSSAEYEKAWTAATRDYRLITSGLVAAAGSPLRRSIVPLAAAAPGLYGGIVERLAR